MSTVFQKINALGQRHKTNVKSSTTKKPNPLVENHVQSKDCAEAGLQKRSCENLCGKTFQDQR